MSLGNASLASCSKTGEDGEIEREREEGGEKTLTKALRINNQPFPSWTSIIPRLVNTDDSACQNTHLRAAIQKRGKVKIEGGKKKGGKTKSTSVT